MSYYQWCEDVEVTLNNHEYYHSKDEILEQIKENEQCIANRKKELFGLCCGNIKELLTLTDIEGNPIDPIDALKDRFDTLFEEELYGLEYLIAHNVDLQYVADNWDNVKEG